ncbi:MAG: hypothetical protein ACI9WU_002444 [Myxococcota bacterium]|jgi:hypothetical protein
MNDRTTRAAQWIGALTLSLLLVSLWRAWAMRWTCDDAFVSFRYAFNLVQGHGLVWNPGERVEGYTNLLWTLAIAAGMSVGLEPEPLGGALGLLSFLVVALGLWSLSRRQQGGEQLPLAMWIFVLMGDVLLWATGGLETMTAAALAVLMAWLLFGADVPGKGRVAAASMAGAALALTRPDGALLVAGIGGGWALLAGSTWPKRILRGLQAGAGGLMAVAAVTAFRVQYYGEWLPNTYYAKSADMPWWDQGWVYVGMLLARDWVLPALGAIALALTLRARRISPGPAAVFGATAALFTIYVARSGGDFMFARRLIPALPLALLALEAPLTRLTQPTLRRGLAVALIVATLLPLPVFDWWTGDDGRAYGILDESRSYPADVVALRKAQGETMAAVFDGLDARFVIEGGLCNLAYYSGLPEIIEANGLTDHTIARQPLAQRGVPGHEKQPTQAYLDQRGVQFMVLHGSVARPRPTTVILQPGPVFLELRRYDKPLMDELARRGAMFTPIEQIIDVVSQRVQREPCGRAQQGLAFLDSLYFRFNAGAGRQKLAQLVAGRCP